MNPSLTDDLLTEIWAIKDSLSLSNGHDLKATCQAMYAEQAQHPEDFVNLGTVSRQDKAPHATLPQKALAPTEG